MAPISPPQGHNVCRVHNLTNLFVVGEEPLTKPIKLYKKRYRSSLPQGHPRILRIEEKLIIIM